MLQTTLEKDFGAVKKDTRKGRPYECGGECRGELCSPESAAKTIPCGNETTLDA